MKNGLPVLGHPTCSEGKAQGSVVSYFSLCIFLFSFLQSMAYTSNARFYWCFLFGSTLAASRYQLCLCRCR